MKGAFDSGHGSLTPGKRTPDGYPENNFNFGVEIYAQPLWKLNGIGWVDTTPDNDNARDDTPLATRCKIANDAKCDFFTSVHYNAMGDTWRDSGGGIESYHYKYPVNTKDKPSVKFVETIHAELIKGTKLADRGVKQANFYVLKNTNMIAGLFELGFMDVKTEAELMKSLEYRKECAVELTRGICKYYGKDFIEYDRLDYLQILKEVSKYHKVWETFINNNPQVNLKGLIENIYYHDKNDV